MPRRSNQSMGSTKCTKRSAAPWVSPETLGRKYPCQLSAPGSCFILCSRGARTGSRLHPSARCNEAFPVLLPRGGVTVTGTTVPCFRTVWHVHLVLLRVNVGVEKIASHTRGNGTSTHLHITRVTRSHGETGLPSPTRPPRNDSDPTSACRSREKYRGRARGSSKVPGTLSPHPPG